MNHADQASIYIDLNPHLFGQGTRERDLPQVRLPISEARGYGTEYIEGIGFGAEAERIRIFNETEDLRQERNLRRRWTM